MGTTPVAGATQTALYCRRSKNGGDGHDTVESQEIELRKYAADHGWDNVKVYRERGISAGRVQDARRKVFYDELGGAIKKGNVDRVLAVEVDRLSRFQLAFWTFIEQCRDLGVEVIATRSNTVLTDPRTSILEISLRSGLASEESRIRSDRQKSFRERQRAAGKPRSGGFRKLGYEWDNQTLRPKEIKLLKRSADMVASGVSLRQVTLMWRDTGVRVGHRSDVEAGQGKFVSQTSLRKQLMTSELLDDATRAEMRRIFSDPDRRKKFSGIGRRTYLLSGGYARCGKCGGELSPSNGYSKDAPDHRQRTYACLTRVDSGATGCHGVRMDATDVEQAVIVALENAGAKLNLPKADATDETTTALEGERTALVSRIEKLEDDYVDGTLSATAMKRQRDRLQTRIAEIDTTLTDRERQAIGRRRLERLQEQGVPSYREAFDELRSLVEAMVERVEVGGRWKHAVVTYFREPFPLPKPNASSIPKGLPKEVRQLFTSGRVSITKLSEPGALPRPS